MHYQWEWRNRFIKLSDLIGEVRNPSVKERKEMDECDIELRIYNYDYPLKHKVGKKEYLFEYNQALEEITFKTYEGEPYLYKGRWYNANNL